MNKPYNSADPAQVAKKKKGNKALQERFERAMQSVMSDREGRFFIHYYLNHFGLNSQPMSGNSWTYFHCGKLEAARDMQRDAAHANHDHFLLMLKEAKEDEGIYYD